MSIIDFNIKKKKNPDLKLLNNIVHTKNDHHIPQYPVFIASQDALLSKIK